MQLLGDEHEQFKQLRSMSLPDMNELSDIAYYDALFEDDDDDEEEKDDPYELASPTQYHPVRLFAMGLQRSMSMPKQDPVKDEPKRADDDFFFPEDDKEVHQQESFLPSFYSEETLRSVLPPPNAPPSSRAAVSEQLNDITEEAITTVSPENKEEYLADASTDCQEPKTCAVAKSSKKSTHKDVAIANLAAFFGGSVATTTGSPKSAANFPEEHTEKDTEQSSMKTRTNSLPTMPVATGKAPQRRRSIFGTNCVSSASEDDDDRQFTPLKESGRRVSMPTSLPSSRLPRKPSLKRISSFKSIGSVKSDKSTSSAKEEGIKPSVSFTNLEIREYDMTLGDNPSCSYGPPVSLGWDYRDAEVVPVEKYERARAKKCPRRSTRQLVLSHNVRKYLLLKTAGYSKAELREAMKEVERIKNQRAITDLLLPASKLDEVMEGVLDHVKLMFQK